jgi:hypothetical protein
MFFSLIEITMNFMPLALLTHRLEESEYKLIYVVSAMLRTSILRGPIVVALTVERLIGLVSVTIVVIWAGVGMGEVVTIV